MFSTEFTSMPSNEGGEIDCDKILLYLQLKLGASVLFLVPKVEEIRMNLTIENKLIQL